MPLRRIRLPIILCAALVAGCSSSPENASPYRITRTTTDQTILGGKHRGAVGAIVEWDSPNATVDLNELVRQVKIVARHEATLRQREVARQRAAATYRHLPPAKKQALKSQGIRYLAVETERNEKSEGRKSVMIWDTYSSDVVGNDVYDIADAPAIGSKCRFDTYAVNYVGTGF